MPSRVTLYTRAGCCLCQTAKEHLERAGRRENFQLDIIDVDSDPALQSLYGEEVPVVAIDGRKAFKFYVSEQELLKKLRARS